MEDKKEVKDLIKVRKSIFSIIKEMLKEKLIPKKDFSVDIEREKNAFRTFDEIYGVDEEAYAIEQENLRIYDEIKDITSMNEVPEIKEETEVEILPETTTKDEFMQLYNDVVENRVSVKCLSISDLLKINLLFNIEYLRKLLCSLVRNGFKFSSKQYSSPSIKICRIFIFLKF